MEDPNRVVVYRGKELDSCSKEELRDMIDSLVMGRVREREEASRKDLQHFDELWEASRSRFNRWLFGPLRGTR